MTKQRTFTGTAARRLLRRALTGTLATLNRQNGIPYASLINVATDIEGQPLLLVSALAWHTKNLMTDPRASVLVAEPPEKGDVLTGTRVTVMGRFERTEAPRISRRYLARHPEADIYAGFGDFAYWRLVPELVHAVAGFGRIETLEVSEVFPAATAMLELEEGALEHMNQDHADALKRFAKRLGGDPAADWKMLAVDGDGADLSDGTQALRLEFPEPVSDAGSLRITLAHLAKA